MPMVGIALATLLSFAPPADGGTEAPIVVAPAPAPAPEPPPPSWGPSSVVVVSQPAKPGPPPPPPPPPKQRPRQPALGIGLMISSAVAFGFGLGGRLGQVDNAVRSCSTWKTDGHDSVTQCFDHYDYPGVDGNDVLVGMAYGSSMVLNMIGTGALGRNRAWQTVHGDGRVRNPQSRVIAGGVMTGLGVAGIATHFALVYADSRNPCTTWECNVKRRALWIAASDGGAAALNIGFGLFSWAGNYRDNLRKYRVQWSLRPGVGPGGAGATFGMRF